MLSLIHISRNKYTYFASKAKKDGYVQIAKIFEETANNEKEDVYKRQVDRSFAQRQAKREALVRIVRVGGQMLAQQGRDKRADALLVGAGAHVQIDAEDERDDCAADRCV